MTLNNLSQYDENGFIIKFLIIIIYIIYTHIIWVLIILILFLLLLPLKVILGKWNVTNIKKDQNKMA